MSWNPLNWFRAGGIFGRGSTTDKLIRALPNPSTILRNTDAWARVLSSWGEAGVRWEPEDSRLLAIVKDTADALNLVGPLLGASGAEKLAALAAQVRMGAAAIGMADDAFDTFWINKGRKILESYLVLRK